jgi:hypothetical protein
MQITIFVQVSILSSLPSSAFLINTANPKDLGRVCLGSLADISIDEEIADAVSLGVILKRAYFMAP